MVDILTVIAIMNLVMFAIYAFKEGVKPTDFLAITLNTMLLAVIIKYHQELKCLIENFPK